MTPPPEKIRGTFTSLKVIDPPTEDWNIYRGQTKELMYILQNPGYHILKNVDFTAFTYIKTKEEGDKNTMKNYAEVMPHEDRIGPNAEIKVTVKVNIPDNYNETVKYKGKIIEYPFRVATKAVAIKSIEEF